MVTDGLTAAPIDLWQWGVENRSGYLKTLTVEEVSLNVMPSEIARVTAKGIKLKGGHYSCPTAIREDWFAMARREEREVAVSFDPRNMGNVYLRDPKLPRGFEPCRLLDGSAIYGGKSLFEIEELAIASKRAEAAGENDRQAKRVLIDQHMAEIESKAKKATRAVADADTPKSKKTAAIRGNRADEKEVQRGAETFFLEGAVTIDRSADSPSPPAPTSSIATERSKTHWRCSEASAMHTPKEAKMAKKPQIEVPFNMLDAQYRPADLPEHAGNPLIEALPPFRQAGELIHEFRRYPHITDDERKLPKATRMMAVSRLNAYLEPLTCHLDVIEKIGLIVRAGYTHRNPLNDAYRKWLVSLYREAMEGKIRALGASTPSTAPSFALFGVSGVGKSTVIERALSFLPQLLRHEKHHFVQVVWLKLDCPLDGSLKQLLGAILAKLDDMLGTSYRKSIGRGRTVDELILDVAKIVAQHHLGLLVIDEIQNLLDASGIGQAKMLNFFVTFANEAKIPVVTVGTTRALGLLEGTFREARRVGDHGTYIWDALSEGEEWTHFPGEPLEISVDGAGRAVDPRQSNPACTSIPRESTPSSSGCSSSRSCKAISDGTECLSEALINDVASRMFKLVAPMLEALRKGDKKAIERYEDLLNKGLTELSEDVEREAKLSLLKEETQSRNQSSAERLHAVSALIAMGFEQDRAQEVVTSLFDAQPDLTCSVAVRSILEALEASKEPREQEATAGKSLKEIVQAAAVSGASPSQALASAGIVERDTEGA